MCEAAEEIQTMRAPTGKNEIAGGYRLDYPFIAGDWFAVYENKKLDAIILGDTIYRPNVIYWDNSEIYHRKPVEIDLQFVRFDEGDFMSKNIEKIAWLPRLDQLIEIVACSPSRFIMSHQENEDSLEMIWLAIVMREKFKKYWNGEKWV